MTLPTKYPLDQTDRILLNILQDDLPLVSIPWDYIGQQIGLSGKEVLTRISRMTKSGTLRGIAPTFESAKRASIVSTLIALRVPEDRLFRVAALINEYPQVSHNFQREHEYNLWFTLTAPSEEALSSLISDILSKTEIHPDCMLNLKTENRYKIDVRFPILPYTGENYD